MPKVTVVTLPNEILDVPQPVVKKKSTSQQLPLRAIFQNFHRIALLLFARGNGFISILAFLLGRVSIMGDIAPVGLAFFAAVAQIEGKKAALLVGLWSMAGVVSAGYYYKVVAYAFAMLLYFFWADKLTRMHKKIFAIPLLMFYAIVCSGLVASLYQQSAYNVLVSLFDAGTCVVLSYIFMYGVPLLIKRKSLLREQDIISERITCLVILLAIAVAGIGNTSVFEYSIRDMAGSLLIMVLSLAGGPGFGASMGVAVGLIIGFSDGNATLTISLYSLAGVLSGAFRGLGKFAVIIGFILGSTVTILYFGQDSQLTKVLEECAIAGGLFFLVPNRQVEYWYDIAFPSCESKGMGGALHLEEAVSKINKIAEVFNELAAAFGSIAADTKGKFHDDELARTITAIGEQVCVNCVKRSQCWEVDFYRTYHGILDILGQGESSTLSIGKMPKVFKENCIKRKELLETIQVVSERNSAVSFWQKKLIENRQMVTEQMKAASVIVGNLAYEIGKVEFSDRNLCRALQEKAAMLDCPLSGVRVTGQRGSIMIEASKDSCNGRRECMNTLLPLAASVIGEKLVLRAECGNEYKKKKCTIHMQVAKRLHVETGTASIAKEGQGVCGDTCAVIPLYKGKMALVLSDGMGSGNQAAVESTMAVKFLQRLLSVGFDVDVAVKTVNSMLLLRTPEESFVTVDMAIIDTYSGETEFLKIGSAPSFLKRVREVTTIKSTSLPIGILQSIEITPVKAKVVDGDYIVMVSDGIADVPQSSLDKENWLANFLRRGGNVKPQGLAEQILAQAMLLSGNRVQDDMTVMVAKIAEQPNNV
jgi:stage II sporulation protein E